MQVCWLRCAEYVSGEVSFVLSDVLLVGVTNIRNVLHWGWGVSNIWKYCRVVWSDNYRTNIYTGCPRRNVQDFGRVFLMLKYTDITQNTYVQS